MAIFTSFQERKKQKYLIGIMVVAVLSLVVILIYRYWFKPEVPPSVTALPPKEVKINFGVFESPLVKSLVEYLQPFEEIPVFEGKPGRENPFEPY